MSSLDEFWNKSVNIAVNFAANQDINKYSSQNWNHFANLFSKFVIHLIITLVVKAQNLLNDVRPNIFKSFYK